MHRERSTESSQVEISFNTPKQFEVGTYCPHCKIPYSVLIRKTGPQKKITEDEKANHTGNCPDAIRI